MARTSAVFFFLEFGWGQGHLVGDRDIWLVPVPNQMSLSPKNDENSHLTCEPPLFMGKNKSSLVIPD
jgi:hypothetical protein